MGRSRVFQLPSIASIQMLSHPLRLCQVLHNHGKETPVLCSEPGNTHADNLRYCYGRIFLSVAHNRQVLGCLLNIERNNHVQFFQNGLVISTKVKP